MDENWYALISQKDKQQIIVDQLRILQPVIEVFSPALVHLRAYRDLVFFFALIENVGITTLNGIRGSTGLHMSGDNPTIFVSDFVDGLKSQAKQKKK